MPIASYAARTEQHVIHSDGPLIVSHGKLNGGSAMTRRLAKKHNRPWKHVNLEKTDFFKAAMDVRAWVVENHIKVLNVAGPRGSKDPRIYQSTKKLLTLLIKIL